MPHQPNTQKVPLLFSESHYSNFLVNTWTLTSLENVPNTNGSAVCSVMRMINFDVGLIYFTPWPGTHKVLRVLLFFFSDNQFGSKMEHRNVTEPISFAFETKHNKQMCQFYIKMDVVLNFRGFVFCEMGASTHLSIWMQLRLKVRGHGRIDWQVNADVGGYSRVSQVKVYFYSTF